MKIKFGDILELISYITDIYDNTPTMTQYELKFLRIDNKGISKKEINQIMHQIASNNFQQNMYAYSIQIIVYKFGRTRGIQYTCISLFSICFSLAVSRWNRHDKNRVMLYTNCRIQIS